MILMSVDLPAPFSPSKALTSPGFISKLTLSRATTPGKNLEMPFATSTGSLDAAERAFECIGDWSFTASSIPLHSALSRGDNPLPAHQRFARRGKQGILG